MGNSEPNEESVGNSELNKEPPGTPYRLGADWVYERETDLRTLTHSVTETRENPHVLREQELLTNRRVYRQGQTIYFSGGGRLR